MVKFKEKHQKKKPKNILKKRYCYTKTGQLQWAKSAIKIANNNNKQAQAAATAANVAIYTIYVCGSVYEHLQVCDYLLTKRRLTLNKLQSHLDKRRYCRLRPKLEGRADPQKNDLKQS